MLCVPRNIGDAQVTLKLKIAATVWFSPPSVLGGFWVSTNAISHRGTQGTIAGRFLETARMHTFRPTVAIL
jgi:hypothetical protein